MFKISTCESPSQRRLLVEGRLVAPWTAELKSACEKAKAGLHDRELVIDVKNLTAVSRDGEDLLLQLMREGITFHCSGVFTRQILIRVARRLRMSGHEARL